MLVIITIKLIGVSYRDVVEILQAYASTRMQSSYRGHRIRWKYQYARKMWSIKNNNLKTKLFKAWAKYVRNRFDLRNFCWRPLKSWQFYLKLRKNRRYLILLNVYNQY